MEFQITALVVDHRSQKDAMRLVQHLLKIAESQPALSVVWIQQTFSDEAPTATPLEHPALHILKWKENLGYGGALRRGIAQSKFLAPSAYWFLNPDLEVQETCFENLREALIQNPRTAAVGPRIFLGNSEAKLWGARGVVDPLFGKTAMTDSTSSAALPRWSYIPGACLMIRKEAYDEVGGITDFYFLYYEETELCVMLQKRAWDLRVVPQAKAFHHVVSREGGIPAPHYAYYFVRNSLAFWERCFEIPRWIQWPRSFLFVFVKEILLPLRKSPSRQVFFSRLGLALQGLRHSWRFGKTSKSLPSEGP